MVEDRANFLKRNAKKTIALKLDSTWEKGKRRNEKLKWLILSIYLSIHPILAFILRLRD